MKFQTFWTSRIGIRTLEIVSNGLARRLDRADALPESHILLVNKLLGNQMIFQVPKMISKCSCGHPKTFMMLNPRVGTVQLVK